MLALFIILILLTASDGLCGPVLEEILNCIKLDHHTLTRDENRFCTIEPGKPVGQTFLVSDEVEKVFRIAVWQAFWHESWQPDEVLVMTLWDSPQKRTAYARFGIPYHRRMWEGAVPMFTLDARVQPNRSYYFELSVEVEPLRPAVLPREWLFSGKRPGFANGDGKLYGIGISRDDYPHGCAYIGGEPQNFDLWFQIHVRKRCDRDKLYQEALGRFNLENRSLKPVREAVQKRDWERAIRELVRHFESRKDLIPEERGKPLYDPDYDTTEADLACEQKHRLADGTIVDLGPHWNHFAWWPERGGVGLTRAGLRKALAEAYRRTGNEKYAKAFNDMLMQFFIHYPSPIRAGVFKPDETIPAALPSGIAGGSIWSGLSIGARMGHGFAFYAPFVNSPYFSLDVRAAFIINLGEMAEVLERMHAGGNWETQMAEALLDFGLTYPEFKGAKAWVQKGLRTIMDNALSTVRPDGVLQEPSINYHSLVMRRYANIIEREQELQKLGLRIPEELREITERMFEFVMYSVLPDGTLPIWGDANPQMKAEDLEWGARLFKRDDFLFVATGGRKGTQPKLKSVGFPHGGFYYMRTGWQPDAHYMGIRCGPHGSHGHRDALSIIVCTYGRLALIDPGVYIYGTPEAEELAATKSHNTVTVDDRNTTYGKADAWMVSERFDFFAGHNEGYQGLGEVRHHRRIWFLKPLAGHPSLWVVFDDIVGEGEHEARLWFRFAPLAVHQDAMPLPIWTSGADGGLLLQVIERNRMKVELGEGIAATDWNRLAKVPIACFRQQGKLPFAFTSLLVPFQGDTPPLCDAELLPLASKAEGARAVWVRMKDEAILIVLNGLEALKDEPKPIQLSLPDGRGLSLVAASAAIRFVSRENRWQPLSLHGVRIRSISLDGQPLFASDKLTECADVLLLRES
jgi:hypothetical protein